MTNTLPDNKDFFNEPETMDETQTSEQEQLPEAVKIGDKAYTQDELQQLVGLGESARDLESKWNTKLDRLMPEYTKVTQKLSEYEKQAQSQEQQRIQEKQTQGQQLTNDEIRKQAATQLRELMRDPEVQTELRSSYVEQRQAERLIEDCEYVIGDYTERGLPAESVDSLLQYMADTGIRNPEIAYKTLHEDALDAWKEKQIKEARQPGLYTTSGSNAGSKLPPEVKVTKDNIAQLVAQTLRGEG